MPLPIKLGTVSIIDAITEFRFKNKKNIEDIFMDMYGSLKKDGFTYEKLPIMELPLAIREGDVNLKYNPYYRIEKGSFGVNIGPSSIAFSIKGHYSGWDDYKKIVIENLHKFDTIVSDWDLERTSMRYINFFTSDKIFDDLKINIAINDKICGMDSTSKSSMYVNELQCEDETIVKIQIAENVEVKKSNSSEPAIGSILDIDTISTNVERPIDDVIEELHSKVKNIFFNLLEDDFLKSLKPKYK